MKIKTQRFQLLLNWVKFLFCKLSTITYELLLQNEPKILPRYPLSLRWQKNAKQSQFPAFSIEKQGCRKKQSQFAFCLWSILPNEPKLNLATMKMQNKPKCPHFQSKIKGCLKNKAKSDDLSDRIKKNQVTF